MAFSYGLLYIDEPVLAEQQRHTSALYSHLMQIRRPARSDRWERERESGNFVLSARLDDDDDSLAYFFLNKPPKTYVGS